VARDQGRQAATAGRCGLIVGGWLGCTSWVVGRPSLIGFLPVCPSLARNLRRAPIGISTFPKRAPFRRIDMHEQPLSGQVGLALVLETRYGRCFSLATRIALSPLSAVSPRFTLALALTLCTGGKASRA
jgi:hypothetical protein